MRVRKGIYIYIYWSIFNTFLYTTKKFLFTLWSLSWFQIICNFLRIYVNARKKKGKGVKKNCSIYALNEENFSLYIANFSPISHPRSSTAAHTRARVNSAAVVSERLNATLQHFRENCQYRNCYKNIDTCHKIYYSQLPDREAINFYKFFFPLYQTHISGSMYISNTFLNPDCGILLKIR